MSREQGSCWGVGLYLRTLIDSARRGDAEAYGALVREHEEVALLAAYLVKGVASDAGDVIQEAFVQAYRSLSKCRSDVPIRPWLLDALQRLPEQDRLAHLPLLPGPD